ncbi:hypothetical protein C5E10_17315 [Pseudoclavibacter sp. RFBG4]|nr:hypothetical protein C5E10_17315 [Pseudoclavibacter sp. RFBG4]
MKHLNEENGRSHLISKTPHSRGRSFKAATALTLGTCLLAGSFVSAQLAIAAPTDTIPVALQVDRQESPVLVDSTPSFSWQMDAAHRGAAQTAYRLVVATSAEKASNGEGDVWDSGVVESNASSAVAYAGPALSPKTSYFWAVQVTDERGETLPTATSSFRTGLKATDGSTGWNGAQWITQPGAEPSLADDRSLATTFDVSTRFQILQGSAGLTFNGVDDDFILLNVAEVDGQYRLKLHEGNAQGIRDFTRDNGAAENPESPRGFDPVNVDVALDGFDPAAEHTLTASLVGGGGVFPSGSTWKISLDGAVLAEFELPGNRQMVRAGLVGLYNDNGTSAKYTDVSLTVPDAAEKLDETQAKLTADPSASAFAEADGAKIADGWITVADSLAQESDTSASDGLFREEFTTSGKTVESAHLYASALGIYEFELNGEKVGDSYLAPGTSDFFKTALYNAYDVTDQIAAGDNAIGAQVSDGWYSGSFGALQKPYGAQPALMANLEITYTDGSTESVATGPNWSYFGEGPITDSNLMDGENYDARLEPAVAGWSQGGFDESGWATPATTSLPAGLKVVGDSASAIKKVEELSPVSRTVDANGNLVFDFGKNIVGNVAINVSGPAGSTVELNYGEMLNDNSATADGPAGTIYNENFRSAKANDFYTIGDSGSGSFEPTFTMHGFRYLEVSGFDGFDANSVGTGDVTAHVLSSATELTMDLETSSDGLNALHENTINGLRGNFNSIPTDTPARDERMGWLGDIQVFTSTASMTADVRNFLQKYTELDLADAQFADGQYPRFAPYHSGWEFVHGTSDPWTDASIIVPYELWRAYGDTEILEVNYEQMSAYATALNEGPRGFVLGDWLSFAKTDTEFVMQAYKVHTIALMAEAAEALGKTEDAQKFRGWHQEWKNTFVATYFPSGGSQIEGVDLETQAAYAIVLDFGLYPDGSQAGLAERLAQLSLAGENGEPALTTGFLGTPAILPALSGSGQLDAAYDLVLSNAYPSWLYTVDQGATTYWERWNSYTLEDGFGDVSMNSYNHYAYGAVSEWIYNTVAGINQDPANPGYQHSVLKPQPDADGRVTWSNAAFTTNYGTLVSDWTTENGAFEYHVEVPANSSATVYVPVADESMTVLEGGLAAADAEGVTLVGIENGTAQLEVTSGSFDFTVGVAPEPTTEPTPQPTSTDGTGTTAPTSSPGNGAGDGGDNGSGNGSGNGGSDAGGQDGDLATTGVDGSLAGFLALLGAVLAGTGAAFLIKKRRGRVTSE